MKARLAFPFLCALNCFLMGQAPKPPTAAELKAFQETKAKAEQGNATAQTSLGVMYANGLGVAKDVKEAANWFSLAANQGHADGQANLGYMYEYGLGVAKDEKDAVNWYNKAAVQGNTAAQFNLGIRYAGGLGVAKDDVGGRRWPA